MKVRYILLILVCLASVVVIFVFYQHRSHEEGYIKENKYYNDNIGWEMEIPTGFGITKDSEIRKLDRKGNNYLKERGLDAKSNDVYHLLSFNNGINSFVSTMNLLPIKEVTQYRDVLSQYFGLIYQITVNGGGVVDSTSGLLYIEKDKTFYSFSTSVKNTEGRFLFGQVYLRRLINNYDLSIIITYNNDADLITMIKALRESKFIW